jgi:putative flippase GtrA
MRPPGEADPVEAQHVGAAASAGSSRTRPDPRLRQQVLRFLVVGAASAVTYFGVVYLMHEIGEFSRIAAVSLGYGASIAVHFWGNRRLTFGQRGGDLLTPLLRYAAVAALNYLITVSVVRFLTTTGGTSLYPALGCAIVTTTSFGFVASRYWIFPDSVRPNV